MISNFKTTYLFKECLIVKERNSAGCNNCDCVNNNGDTPSAAWLYFNSDLIILCTVTEWMNENLTLD